MFKYVHTLTKLNFSRYEIALLTQHVDYFLISLINGLNRTSFGLDTLFKTAKDIDNIRQRFIINEKKKWFIDSGGYSIIVGDVSPRDMIKFIECYTYYLENFAPTQCDYIFSLDIPILLKYPTYNTVDYIYTQNMNSCERSKKILNNNKDLYDKFIFVWQFKTFKQYKIWDKVYNNVFAECEELKHFGIGGQVGLRGITGIDFSPFIASSYKILDLIAKKNLAATNILHLLGIYGLHDRFLISILDKLFNNYYLKDYNCKVQLTFDTVAYLLRGLYNVRKLTNIIFDEDNNILYDKTSNLIDKLHLLVEDKETLEVIKYNLEHINKKENISDPTIIATLNIVKNKYIDYIINDVVDRYKIVDLFIECKTYNKFKNNFYNIYNILEKDYPYIFKNKLSKILLNFQYCYAFHDWWCNGRDLNRLDKMMLKFIKIINFPVDLSGSL